MLARCRERFDYGAQADAIARWKVEEDLKQSQAEFRAAKEETDLLRRNSHQNLWRIRQLMKKTARYDREVHKTLCVLHTLCSNLGPDSFNLVSQISGRHVQSLVLICTAIDAVHTNRSFDWSQPP